MPMAGFERLLNIVCVWAAATPGPPVRAASRKASPPAHGRPLLATVRFILFSRVTPSAHGPSRPAKSQLMEWRAVRAVGERSAQGRSAGRSGDRSGWKRSELRARDRRLVERGESRGGRSGVGDHRGGMAGAAGHAGAVIA